MLPADRRPLGGGAADRRRRRVRAGWPRAATYRGDLGRRDPRLGRPGGDARALAARLRAGRQPPDPVAARLPAPHARDAGRDHRLRRGRWRSACCCRPTSSSWRRSARSARRSRSRSWAVGLPAALQGARPRPARTGCRSTSGGALPIPGVLCAVMSPIAFVALLVEHGDARWFGVGWMVAGIALYVDYRISQGKPVLKRVTVPEAALTRRAPEAEYGSMLVPILGTPLDDDIMQTAGRLAAEENGDDGEGGAVIEALWVFEVPMALPLDARVPDEELKRARAALKRAKAVGEEYEGVEVATAVVRARRAGQAIVHEAKRRGVEAVVLAAEEPTRVGGGLRLGGKPGLHDTSVGETTRYVVNKAPCRVILTAPPAAAALDPIGPAAASTRRCRWGTRWPSPTACPIPTLLARVRAVFVLVVGAGRVGAALATSGAGWRPYRLGPRRGPALARAPRRRARPFLGGGRRALHDRHGARDRRADRGRRRGGRRLHRLHERRQHEPRRVPDRPAQVRGRARDRPRARSAPRGLVCGAGPADDLPDADRDRAARPRRRFG